MECWTFQEQADNPSVEDWNDERKVRDKETFRAGHKEDLTEWPKVEATQEKFLVPRVGGWEEYVSILAREDGLNFNIENSIYTGAFLPLGSEGEYVGAELIIISGDTPYQLLTAQAAQTHVASTVKGVL